MIARKIVPTARTRRGLTLLELIVVLTILIALAAILIPTLPGMLGRSHDASAATNVGEITKFVQVYNQLYSGYPNNLDNLIEATGTGGLLTTLAGGGNLNAQLTTSTLTTNELAALNNVGVTGVASLTATAPTGSTTWSPTFYPYTTSPPTVAALATSTNVAILSGAGATPTGGVLAGVQKLGLSPTGKYVVFGFGSANTAVGRVVTEAPVHFPDQQTVNPATHYERYGLIFKVSDTNTSLPAITQAVFIGTVCLLDDGIETAGDHISDYFNKSVPQ